MKSLVESLFDRDLIEKTSWAELDEYLNDNTGSSGTEYKYLIHYLISSNPKYSYLNSSEKAYYIPIFKGLSTNCAILLKELKKQIKDKVSISIFNCEKTYDIWRDDYEETGITPFEDVVSDIANGGWDAKDGIYRFKKLDKKWVEIMNEYNSYYDHPLVDTKCEYYLGFTDEYDLYIMGFKKGIPEDILKLFGFK